MTVKREKNVIEKSTPGDKVFFEMKFAHRRQAVIALLIVLALPTLATLLGMSKNIASLCQALMVLIGFLGLVYLFADALVNGLNLIVKLLNRKKSGNPK